MAKKSLTNNEISDVIRIMHNFCHLTLEDVAEDMDISYEDLINEGFLQSSNQDEIERWKVVIIMSKWRLNYKLTESKKALESSYNNLMDVEQNYNFFCQHLFNESFVGKSQNDWSLANRNYYFLLEKLEQAKKDYTQVQNDIEKYRKALNHPVNIGCYLVAPEFNGKLPACGKLISTEIQNYCSCQAPSEDFLLNPDANEMVQIGYDLSTAIDYGKALVFVSLCMEYTSKGIQYTILCSDEKIRKLLDIHLG